MKDELKTNVSTPWTNGEEEFVGMLGFISQAKLQLLYFQKQNDTEYIRKDISGYTEILDRGIEENAQSFMRIKNEARLEGRRFSNNLEVISEIKKQGLWR